MPLTPEGTQTETKSANSEATAGDQSVSGVGAVLNSRYLKPAAALLVAVGAGFLVQRLRDRRDTSKK